jgi:hypothetical protein
MRSSLQFVETQKTKRNDYRPVPGTVPKKIYNPSVPPNESRGIRPRLQLVFDLTRFLPQISLCNLRKLDCYANRFPPPDQVRGHAALENAKPPFAALLEDEILNR